MSLRIQPRAQLTGDFNLDPWREVADVDAVRNVLRFPEAPPFDAQRRAQKPPPFWSVPLNRQTWDHVLSEGFVGRCVTLDAAEKFPGISMRRKAKTLTDSFTSRSTGC